MRVVLDREKLVFLPIKHHDLFVCANLAWIECYPGQPYFITNLDENFLCGLTDFEQIMLYRNTVGSSPTQYGHRLRNVLFELASRIPEREVLNFHELEVQALSVPEKRKARYLYNPGSLKPAVQPELFSLAPLKMEKASDEGRIAASPPVLPASPPPAPAPATPQGGAAQRPPAPAGAPRQGGVAATVWQVADKAWEAAGSPKDTKEILAIRKDLMVTLENDYGIKRNTSSNELGRWMKQKIL